MNEWTCMEQIHILEASTDEEAFAKALKIGQSEAHFYTNSKGELVFWKFVGLENLEKLLDDSPSDGSEIRSRIFSSRDPKLIIRPQSELTVFREQALKDFKAVEIILQRPAPPLS